MEVGTMEHRWSRRIPLRTSVTLALPSWEKLQASICDVSLGGLAIMHPQHALPVNSLATLSFSLQQDEYVNAHRLLAQVVHSDAERIGFLFLEPGVETLRGLREVLYSPASKISAMSTGHPHAA